MTCICGVSFLLPHLCGLWGPKWGHQVCVAGTFICRAFLLVSLRASYASYAGKQSIYCLFHVGLWISIWIFQSFTMSLHISCDLIWDSNIWKFSNQPFFTHFLTSPAMFWELRGSFWTRRAHLVIRKISSLAMKFFIVCYLISAHWIWA